MIVINNGNRYGCAIYFGVPEVSELGIAADCYKLLFSKEWLMRKLACYCDRCAIEADWSLRPSTRNSRFFDLILKCHGEEEKFLVAATDLVRPRDPSTGIEIQSPLFVIGFDGKKASSRVRIIQNILPNLSIRILNNSNRLMGE